MTRANDNANKRRKTLERRVRQKLRRLQRKGISTGSITPLRYVDPANTQKVKAYNRELEKFNSRTNQYVAGYQGTPIKASEWRELKRLEREWNKKHNAYWRRKKDDKLIGQDMTLAQKAFITTRKTLFGDVEYQRDITPDVIRGQKDLERKKKRLKVELQPGYEVKRAKQMRRDVLDHIDTYNSKELKRAIKSLTNEELVILQNESLFVEDFFTFDYDWTEEQWEERTNYLIEIINQVKQRTRK